MTPDITPSPATREEKLEAIRRKCVEANPEIMEWKEGRRVENKIHGYQAVIVDNETICRLIGVVQRGNVKGFCKTLGRPIRLADVLLSFQINATFQMDDRALLHSGGLRGRYGPWNLRDDDLSRQSDECLSFLFSLLNHA